MATYLFRMENTHGAKIMVTGDGADMEAAAADAEAKYDAAPGTPPRVHPRRVACSDDAPEFGPAAGIPCRFIVS